MASPEREDLELPDRVLVFTRIKPPGNPGGAVPSPGGATGSPVKQRVGNADTATRADPPAEDSPAAAQAGTSTRSRQSLIEHRLDTSMVI